MNSNYHYVIKNNALEIPEKDLSKKGKKSNNQVYIKGFTFSSLKHTVLPFARRFDREESAFLFLKTVEDAFPYGDFSVEKIYVDKELIQLNRR